MNLGGEGGVWTTPMELSDPFCLCKNHSWFGGSPTMPEIKLGLLLAKEVPYSPCSLWPRDERLDSKIPPLTSFLVELDMHIDISTAHAYTLAYLLDLASDAHYDWVLEYQLSTYLMFQAATEFSSLPLSLSLF